MSSADRSDNSSVNKPSILRKYFFLWLFLACSGTLFSIMGLHYYADTVDQFSYELNAPHVKFASIGGDTEWVCYLEEINKGKSTQLGSGSDYNAPYVKLPSDLGYCDGYLQTKITSWWDIFR